jgi:plastocyanin
LNGRLLKWRRRRGTVAPPNAGRGSHFSRTTVAAVVIAAIIVVSGVYYLTVYNKASSGHFTERIIVGIGGAFYNSTDPSASLPAAYYPANFTVPNGATVILAVTNTDNLTHGLAVPQFSVDTGPMKPNASVDITFTPSGPGNYTYYEPAADCGGGNCDSGQDLTGWFVVQG